MHRRSPSHVSRLMAVVCSKSKFRTLPCHGTFGQFRTQLGSEGNRGTEENSPVEAEPYLRGRCCFAMKCPGFEGFVVMRRIGLHSCPYCGKDEIYVLPPKTWRDDACCFFFLQVVRCHSCSRRHYRPVFLPPVPVAPVKKPIQTADDDEQRERSA
jgi:hypothetical protein